MKGRKLFKSADIFLIFTLHMKYISRIIYLFTILCCSASCNTTRTKIENITSAKDNKSMEVQMYIASEKRSGYGVGPQSCFLIKYKPEEKWQYFYSDIQDFDYEPGYEYLLLLQRTERENIPQDASKYIYTLKKIISKTATKSNGLPPKKN